MEGASMCSSLADDSEAEHERPPQESDTSDDHPHLNGRQETDALEEAEVRLGETHGKEQRNRLPPGALENLEEADNQWETIVWPVYTMTRTTAHLSFATVQWDMPDPSLDVPLPLNDHSLANELDMGAVHGSEDRDIELHLQEDTEQQDGVKVLGLLNAESKGESVSWSSDTDMEQQAQEAGHPVQESGDISDDDKMGEVSEEEAERLEEQTATGVNCNEAREDAESTCISCPRDKETHGEPIQNAITGPTQQTDQLIHLEHSEHSNIMGPLETGRPECGGALTEQLHAEHANQTVETTIFKDVDQELCRSQSGPSQKQEKHGEETESAQGTADSQETAPEKSDHKPTEPSGQTGASEKTNPRMQPHSESKQLQNSERLSQPAPLNQNQQTHEDSRLQSAEPQQAEKPSRSNGTGQLKQPKEADQTVPPELTVPVETSERAERMEMTEQPQQMVQSEQPDSSLQMTSVALDPLACSGTVAVLDILDRCKTAPQPFAEAEVSEFRAVAEISDPGEGPAGGAHRADQAARDGDASSCSVVENGEQSDPPHAAEVCMNGGRVNREKAQRLAERLYRLEDIHRIDVVKHLDKDNDFSRAVGEEFLQFFDFTDQTLDNALRSFLQEVVLIGETQERERVLQHFSCRFHQCNPNSFSSSGAVLTLTCALMLLNTDLHGQNVEKAMSTSTFVSNLDGMNEGQSFNKDMIKTFYNSIKSEPLKWAIDEKELNSSMLPEEDGREDMRLRSKSNPFQDLPHDKNAKVFKQGFLQRKAHADIDGKRTPWGKRSWKTFFGVLRGMVLYLQKDDFRKENHGAEEVVSVHHSLAEQAADYTKKPHVFRLHTADWRVFLFQASSKAEMSSWINRINLVSALHSSLPFPAAVGSQRRFSRPILPSSQSAQTLDHQLQSHAGMLESFQTDLTYLQQSQAEGRKMKAKELEEHRLREEYLLHEKYRYEAYITVLEVWRNSNKTDSATLGYSELAAFDRAMLRSSLEDIKEEDEGGALKKSVSSPSLELEMVPPPVVKVRRNISERRTYRRNIIPRRSRDL